MDGVEKSEECLGFVGDRIRFFFDKFAFYEAENSTKERLYIHEHTGINKWMGFTI